MNAPLPGAVKILRAAATDVSMRGIATNIRPVVPAALAFPVRARMDNNVVCRLRDPRLRSNEDEAQIIVERLQQFQSISCCMHFDLRLQGRAYFSGSAQGFDFLLDFRAHRTDLVP